MEEDDEEAEEEDDVRPAKRRGGQQLEESDEEVIVVHGRSNKKRDNHGRGSMDRTKKQISTHDDSSTKVHSLYVVPNATRKLRPNSDPYLKSF